jgi:ATP-dependent Lhr-like helicase
MADGIVIAMDSDDTLEAMVIARRTMAEDLEPVSIPEKPLDVLTHQIVGLMTQKSRWYFREILDLFRNAYPYRDLTEQELEAVLNYMHSRFPRLAWVSFQDKVVLRPRRLKDPYSYYFDKLSMIPDIRQYLVIDESTETPVGLLDEAFVAEYGSPGTKFIVQGRSWKMVSLRGDKIYVKPVTDPTGSIPSWMGEEIPVPFEIAQEVGKIRRIAVEMIKSGENGRTIASRLSREYPAPTLTILRALSETFMQLDQGQAIPTDRTVTLEDWEDYVIISAHFGSMVNRTLGMMLAHILSEEAGMTFGIQQDPYRIVLWTSGVADSHRVAQLLKGLTDDEASQLIRQAVVKSGLFKRRLVHVARRFGALSRWVDLGSLSLRQLMRGFEGTVVFEEALKETFEKDLDLPNTLRVLSHIRDGEIEIVILRADHEPSPISRIGIERISRKTDLIPPEKMKRILIESTKARILNEVKTLACISCWQYAHIERVGDLPKTLKCPHCKSPLAVLDLAEEDIARLAGKNKRNLSRQDQKILERAHDSAKLTAKYGKMAALALSGKRIEPADAEKILRHNRGLSDSFFESIMKTEREALKRRFL